MIFRRTASPMTSRLVPSSRRLLGSGTTVPAGTSVMLRGAPPGTYPFVLGIRTYGLFSLKDPQKCTKRSLYSKASPHLGFSQVSLRAFSLRPSKSCISSMVWHQTCPKTSALTPKSLSGDEIVGEGM